MSKDESKDDKDEDTHRSSFILHKDEDKDEDTHEWH